MRMQSAATIRPGSLKHRSAAARAGICVLALLVLAMASATATAQNKAAHQQFLFAYKLLQQDENQLAAEAFDKYLDQYPNAPKQGDARYFRAMLHRKAGDAKQAASLLQNVPAPKLVADYAVKLLRGQVLLDLKQHSKAIAPLEAIDTQSLEPKVSATVHHLRGLAYRGANNLEAAAASFKQAANAHKSQRGQALLNLGRVRAMQEQPNAAIEALKQAFSVQAVAAEAARLAGDLSYENDQLKQAARFYKRVLQNHQSSPHFGPAVIGLMWSQYDQQAYEAAIDTFAQYQQPLPQAQQGEAHYLTGSAWRSLNKPSKAKDPLTTAAKQLEGDQQAKALYKLADVYLSLKQYQPLRETVSRLKRLFPDHTLTRESLFLLTSADAQQGRLSKAVDRLSALIDKGRGTPFYPRAVLRRARLYAKADQHNAAIADYERYLQVAGRDSAQLRQAMLKLGDLYYRTGQYEKAGQTTARLLAKSDLSPSLTQQTLYRDALAHIKLNELEPALAALNQLQKQHPVNPFAAEVTYYRALLLTSLDRGSKAAPLLKEAAGQKKLSQAQRGNMLRLLAAHYRETDQPAQAARTLARLQSMAGASAIKPAQLLWLGRYRLDNNAPKDALKALEPLLAKANALKASQRAEASYLAARAYRQTDQPAAALKQLRLIVKRAEGYTLQARLEQARALHDQDKTDQAIDVLETLINNTQQARIAAQAHYDVGQLYQARAARLAERQQREAAAEARGKARRHFKRLVVLYDQFEQLQPLPRHARLQLIELAWDRDDRQAIQKQLSALADGPAPYEKYAKAMQAAIEANRTAAALNQLRALRQDEAVTNDQPLAKAVAQAIQRLENRR